MTDSTAGLFEEVYFAFFKISLRARERQGRKFGGGGVQERCWS